MSIVMIVVVVVEHEGACVRARVMRWRAIHAMTKEMRFQGSARRWTLFTDFYLVFTGIAHAIWHAERACFITYVVVVCENLFALLNVACRTSHHEELA